MPIECTIDGRGRRVSWPLPVHTHPGHSAPVYLKVRGCAVFEEAGYPEKEIQFRAVYDGSEKVSGASAPATTEFVSRTNANRVATDAVESVGPGSVDLLTGSFTMSHTDVSIPVPGYEADLEFTRTYSSSIDPSLQGYSTILGGAWQPAEPLESEGEAEAWSRIIERVIPQHPAVYGDECWEEKEEGEELKEVTIPCPDERCTIEMCQEWVEEEEQPREEWIELLDSEGAAMVFEIAEGTYISPEYAKELKLTKSGTNFILAYPNGTHDIFAASKEREWVPAYVSFQASPNSMRLVYKPVTGNQLRLEREIAPSQVECIEFRSSEEPGCRTLAFEYKSFLLEEKASPRTTEKLVGIKYYGPSGNHAAATTVAEYSYKQMSTTKVPYFESLGYEQVKSRVVV